MHPWFFWRGGSVAFSEGRQFLAAAVNRVLKWIWLTLLYFIFAVVGYSIVCVKVSVVVRVPAMLCPFHIPLIVMVARWSWLPLCQNVYVWPHSQTLHGSHLSFTFQWLQIILLEIYHVAFDSLLQGDITPLIMASHYGHKEVAVLLLEHSANVDAQYKVIVMQRVTAWVTFLLNLYVYHMEDILYVKRFVGCICTTWSPYTCL